jgi:hypothetical protein
MSHHKLIIRIKLFLHTRHFTVQSAYNLQREHNLSTDGNWKSLWNWKGPRKTTTIFSGGLKLSKWQPYLLLACDRQKDTRNF